MEEALEMARSKDTKERMAGVERLHQGFTRGVIVAFVGAAVLSGEHFKLHFNGLVPTIVERLGDSKQPVRDAARRLLLTLMGINDSEFTEMAWEGFVGAVDAARINKQQVAQTAHLMKALLEQKDGLDRRILTKAGVDNTSVLQATDDFIYKHPKVIGETSGPVMDPDLNALLSHARNHKREMKDDFVSVEHFLLAFLSDKRVDTLMRHLPFHGQEGLREFEKVAVKLEEKIYDSATCQVI